MWIALQKEKIRQLLNPLYIADLVQPLAEENRKQRTPS